MILFIKFGWIIIYNQQRKKVCLNFFDQLSCKKFDIMNTMLYFNNPNFIK